MSWTSRPTRARVAVGATKVAVLGTIVALACGVGAGGGSLEASQSVGHESQVQAHLERLMSTHRCSTTGFGADVIPGSAIVDRANHYAVVSFDDGWASFTGDKPGTLVAVCRARIDG